MATFSTGLIVGLFHWDGTTPFAVDLLNRSVITLANMGAPSRKNQVGIPSSPVAVGFSGSRMWNSDVNKDLGFKAKAKDLGFKAKVKDLEFKAKAKDLRIGP